jgi:hypothetical protein
MNVGCATPQQLTVAHLCTRPAMRRTHAFAFGQTALSGSTQPRQRFCAGDTAQSTAQSVVRDLL